MPFSLAPTLAERPFFNASFFWGRTELREGRLWAEIEPLEPVSEVGSGDALLAGFLAARQGNRPLEDVLKHAVGCGAANTQTFGAGSFDPRDAARLAGTVTLRELEPASE